MAVLQPLHPWLGTPLSVGELTERIAALLRDDPVLQDVCVRGEVSTCTRAASGHLYFSLKDDRACLQCVMFRSDGERLPFRIESGMRLLAWGAVDLYAPRGQYQLIVRCAEPDGLGALYLALEQARQRLREEGLLDPARKRPLPAFPECVAVVTSLAGAAVRDICAVLRRSPWPPRIVLVPAQVQGDGAEQSLCAALRLANEASGADVIILGRGGGAVEDLWAFNSERLARAIATSRLPVISAVGHEIDRTLADEAADFRAPTPTAAAERIVALREEQVRRCEQAFQRVRSLFRERIRLARLELDGSLRRAPLAHPLWMVERRRQQLDDLTARLARSMQACETRWRNRLALVAGRLDALSPLATLARGYAAVTRLPEGAPVRRIGDVRENDEVCVRLQDGAFRALVRRVERE